MEDKERQSICALEPGHELKAFNAIGPFDIEQCGPLMNCSHRVDKISFKNGVQENVELYYCAMNWPVFIGGVVALLLILWFIKRRFFKSPLPM